MHNIHQFRNIIIKLEEGSISLPLYKVMAAIAEQLSINEIVSFNTPFGEITLKT